MKVQITCDDELMKRVDTFADDNYMSRSGVFSLAVAQFLNAHVATKAMQDMADAIKKIAETGKVDHETMEQVEEFERLAKMFSLK